MKTQFYLIRPFTNLHVGSGTTNFGVIDNLIERDATTGFPCINSTGLKGAMKQMLNGQPGISMKQVFGSEADINKRKKDDDSTKKFSKKEDDTQQGACFFFPGHLLALPIRSDKTPFVLATCPSLLRQYLRLRGDLGLSVPSNHQAIQDFAALEPDSKSAYTIGNKHVGASLGGFGITVKNSTASILTESADAILEAFGSTLQTVCLINDEAMIDACSDMNLPVISRNALDNGDSINLWYEQVLPRESLLYTAIAWDTAAHATAADKCFASATLQIGGNASVGYGFTKLNLLA